MKLLSFLSTPWQRGAVFACTMLLGTSLTQGQSEAITYILPGFAGTGLGSPLVQTTDGTFYGANSSGGGLRHRHARSRDRQDLEQKVT